MKLQLRSMLIASLVFFVTPAHALIIEISETPDFSGFVLTQEDTDNNGVVSVYYDSSYHTGLNDWTVNVVTGLSSPAIGDSNVDKLDLNSVNVSGGQGTLYIRLTDTDFDRLSGRYVAGVGGTSDGSVSFQSYADATNTAFGKGILLADTGLISAAFPFSDVDSGSISMTGPYSMSIYATITHTGPGQATSFNYAIAVPEPGTLALLGLGLLGIGTISRRKARIA